VKRFQILMVGLLAFAIYGASWYFLMTPQIGSCLGTLDQCYSSLSAHPELVERSLTNLIFLGLISIALSVGALLYDRNSRTSKTI
jgi:hypothetical protein